jgi:hypothetical protein
MVKLSLQGDGVQFDREITIDQAANILKQYQSGGIGQFWDKLTDRQKIYCRGTNDKWITNSNLRNYFAENSYPDMRPVAIAGIRRGLNKKARKYLNEAIDEQEWIEPRDGGRNQNRYRIKPKFKGALSSLF